MMSHAFDRFLPPGMSWRDLFDLIIVQARKPVFFTTKNPIFEIVDDEAGLLKPYTRTLEAGGIYLGGYAGLVERDLGLSGEEILYVGDHIYSDVHVSKDVLRWRTALVVRALEKEMLELERFKPQQARLSELMDRKARLEHTYSLLRLDLQRIDDAYTTDIPRANVAELRQEMQELRSELVALDTEIAPLAQASGELCNSRWGPVMRAGNDKSHLARQIEASADIYMSRVSNLLYQTPFVYLRSPRGSLPHDSGPAGGA
jgi:hypothetical protein